MFQRAGPEQDRSSARPDKDCRAWRLQKTLGRHTDGMWCGGSLFTASHPRFHPEHHSVAVFSVVVGCELFCICRVVCFWPIMTVGLQNSGAWFPLMFCTCCWLAVTCCDLDLFLWHANSVSMTTRPDQIGFRSLVGCSW